MACVVFDCESDGLPDRGVSRSDPEASFRLVNFTVVCALVLDGECDAAALGRATRRTVWRDGSPDELASLLAAFDEAAVIVGYNVLGFDFPLLYKHYSGDRGRYFSHRLKTFDPFDRIRSATNSWPKLDKLLGENGLCTKKSNGAEAVRMWERGDRAELEAYCREDVELTARLALLPSLSLDNVPIPSALYSIRAALAAAATAGQLAVPL